jgi:hypothetical protein
MAQNNASVSHMGIGRVISIQSIKMRSPSARGGTIAFLPTTAASGPRAFLIHTRIVSSATTADIPAPSSSRHHQCRVSPMG